MDVFCNFYFLYCFSIRKERITVKCLVLTVTVYYSNPKKPIYVTLRQTWVWVARTHIILYIRYVIFPILKQNNRNRNKMADENVRAIASQHNYYFEPNPFSCHELNHISFPFVSRAIFLSLSFSFQYSGLALLVSSLHFYFTRLGCAVGGDMNRSKE